MKEIREDFAKWQDEIVKKQRIENANLSYEEAQIRNTRNLKKKTDEIEKKMLEYGILTKI